MAAQKLTDEERRQVFAMFQSLQSSLTAGKDFQAAQITGAAFDIEPTEVLSIAFFQQAGTQPPAPSPDPQPATRLFLAKRTA